MKVKVISVTVGMFGMLLKGLEETGKIQNQRKNCDHTDDNNLKIMIGRLVLFTNPSARAGYDTRSIFKRS